VVVSILDYGAGNVRSLVNAIKSRGYEIVFISTAADISSAKVIVFPGVGIFGQAMQSLKSKGWTAELRKYIQADRPFFGICIGMQSLFQGSVESPDVEGLGIIPGNVTRFDSKTTEGTMVRVPQMGWNGVSPIKESIVLEATKPHDGVYFVHSFCAKPTVENREWILTLTDYGEQRFISMIQKGNVVGTQFHPEKSGVVGLDILDAFLKKSGLVSGGEGSGLPVPDLSTYPSTKLAKRVVACLDVRSNDAGDLVVTKGDQYDCREATEAAQEGSKGEIRNLGKPVGVCKQYYDQGADEIVFLNITSFKKGVIEDLPMLKVLELSSENVFVPLTVGGGIRDYTDAEGKVWSALDVASQYFRAGADKVSIGSDAVYAVEEYLAAGGVAKCTSCLELISKHYGAQAVVVSVDPKRVYVDSPEAAPKGVFVGRLRVEEGEHGPSGELFCWWQVTVKGGRETRDLDAITLARVSEVLGAGEIMLNCIDMDGQCKGYDIPLLRAVQDAVTVPVIASSGAGKAAHFSEVFEATDVSAALAAGMFHRGEVKISEVKDHMRSVGIPTRS